MWLLSGRCRCRTRLDGKTAVVTGANCGIGQATALDFVRRGARVVLACRDLKKAAEAADDIRAQCQDLEGAGHVAVVELDLASLASVRRCAQQLLASEPAIHLLVNNAGVCFCPFALTEDGFESQLAVNHLGHFLLTCLLLPLLVRSAPARVVVVASCVYMFASTTGLQDARWEGTAYSSVKAYTQSKLANVMFAAELGRRLQGTGVTTYSLHPGVVASEGSRHADQSFFRGARWIYDKLGALLVKTCEQGAQTTLHCALSEELAGETGLYYRDCKRRSVTAPVNDQAARDDMWRDSARLVGLGDCDPLHM